ncbi:MAG: carbohydrate binding family 9 domain-containing protein, partial [Gemmatimonadaceae bacterium]
MALVRSLAARESLYSGKGGRALTLRATFSCCAALLVWNAAAVAQPSGKSVTAVRIAGESPRIDGRLDDVAWEAAQIVSDFVQQRPVEGANPTERTEALIVYDDAALYVGARMFRRDPRLIARPMTRRDVTGNAERFAVVLDTYLDRRTAVAFTISAAGVKGDLYVSRDSESDGLSSQYNPVWDARATIDSTGWTAEMRIPFAQLRFTAAEEQVWGLMLERLLPDKLENERWILIPQQQTGYVSRFGTLRGIRGVQPKRPIELVPYVAADATHRANIDVHNPFNDPFAGRAGMDAKLGIGSNLTLDLTVNPD